MNLQVGQVLTSKDIAAFFEISERSFYNKRDQKLEMLKEYAKYEIETTKTGRFKNVHILEVYCDTYFKSLKDPFIKWLNNVNPWDITGEDGVSSCTVITNYYCQQNNIKYDGPHYISKEVTGTSEDGKRKISQNVLVANPEFKHWHYLYRICRNYYIEKGSNPVKNYIDCSVNEWNPTHLKITTKEMLAIREAIYEKYFGRRTNDEAIELDDYINEITPDMNAMQIKEEMRQLKMIKALSDKEKRIMAANECKNAGVLKRKGRKRTD